MKRNIPLADKGDAEWDINSEYFCLSSHIVHLSQTIGNIILHSEA